MFQAATVSVFAGRSYQHFFFDIPIREILWDADWMKTPVQNLTDLTWEEYLTSPAVDQFIQNLTYFGGVLYLLCALIALFFFKVPGWIQRVLWAGVAGLFCLAFLYTKESFFHAGQFFEYSLQVGAPVFLLLNTPRLTAPRFQSWGGQFWGALKIAIALCFTCHGLYAVGYYPRPVNFLEMTMHILQVSEQGAKSFLNVAGLLDFAVAIGIFLPGKAGRIVCLYAAAWGLVTALARILGNFYIEFPFSSLHQWAYQAVFRLPQFFLPFALWLFLSQTFDSMKKEAG